MYNVIPFRNQIRQSQNLFDRFFEDIFRSFPRADPYSPAVDFYEDDVVYKLMFEIPGVKKEDLDIEISDGVLIVAGEKKKSSDAKTNRSECVYGSFSRSFSMPNSVDKSKIAAKFDDGILTLDIPKLPAKKPHKVKIE